MNEATDAAKPGVARTLIRAGLIAAVPIAAAASVVIIFDRFVRAGSNVTDPSQVSAELARVESGAPTALALDVPEPKPLPPTRTSVWAAVRASAPLRTQPSSGAHVIGRTVIHTSEGTTSLLTVLGSARGHAGTWARVAVPAVPHGRVGWVPRASLGGYATSTSELVVNRRSLTAVLYRQGEAVLRAPVGVGARNWPTPSGRFLVRSRLTRYRSSRYGPLAFGTTARSAKLTDWPGGGVIGIHGTNQPGLIPGYVSHGCIRLRNRDLIALSKLMPVGTPVRIV